MAQITRFASRLQSSDVKMFAPPQTRTNPTRRSKMKTTRASLKRVLSLLVCGLMMAMIAALPFAARPQQVPFDASRMVADLTETLQLTPEQTARLNDLLAPRRPRIDQILQQMSQFPPGSPQVNELRGQVERERRALLGELAPALRPEQQV